MLFKSILYDYNTDEINLNEIRHESFKYIDYYIYYIKTGLIFKKYITNIFIIARYLQDIDTENIMNGIISLCISNIDNKIFNMYELCDILEFIFYTDYDKQFSLLLNYIFMNINNSIILINEIVDNIDLLNKINKYKENIVDKKYLCKKLFQN